MDVGDGAGGTGTVFSRIRFFRLLISAGLAARSLTAKSLFNSLFLFFRVSRETGGVARVLFNISFNAKFSFGFGWFAVKLPADRTGG